MSPTPKKRTRKIKPAIDGPMDAEAGGALHSANAPAFEGLDAEIRRRAYDLFVARGSADGSDLADWLEAERDVLRP
ncbi:MAG: DUF2934 domain-containing protein [Gemmatimonadaceae bacterium]